MVDKPKQTKRVKKPARKGSVSPKAVAQAVKEVKEEGISFMQIGEPTAKVIEITQASSQPEPTPTCASCRFYAPLQGVGINECRRFPPTQSNRWAWVGATDWCGEWQGK
jgi:hypothetical protein